MGLGLENEENFYTAYPMEKRLGYTLGIIIVAVLVAGFWNSRLVEDFGRNVVAVGTIGDPSELAIQYESLGGGFGFLFAAIAGLAATFTNKA